MHNAVSWNLQLAVQEGRLDEARTLMEEMVDSTRGEPGAVGYEWFLSDDGSTCHIVETYRDSAAALTHLGTFGSRFAERFLQCFAPTALHVYGEPTPELSQALDGFGAAYLGTLGGFRR